MRNLKFLNKEWERKRKDRSGTTNFLNRLELKQTFRMSYQVYRSWQGCDPAYVGKCVIFINAIQPHVFMHHRWKNGAATLTCPKTRINSERILINWCLHGWSRLYAFVFITSHRFNILFEFPWPNHFGCALMLVTDLSLIPDFFKLQC